MAAVSSGAPSAALVRQLTIKSSSLRRLRADELSYAEELRQLSYKLDVLQTAASADGLSADDLSDRRRAVVKQREFIDECRATQSDIKIRLDSALTELQTFVQRNGDALRGTAEMATANRLIRKPFHVTVFGSSTTVDGSDDWAFAHRLGAALGAHGFHVVNGGYGGTMEAVSAGARTVNGATVEGVISPQTFPQRGAHGNRHLTSETPTETLLDRLSGLIRNRDAFVVLPGSIGTLTELCLVWNIAAVQQLTQQGADNAAAPATATPIIAVAHPWRDIVTSLGSTIAIPPAFVAVIDYAESVEEIIEKLEKSRERTGADVSEQTRSR